MFQPFGHHHALCTYILPLLLATLANVYVRVYFVLSVIYVLVQSLWIRLNYDIKISNVKYIAQDLYVCVTIDGV
jgi:hypothetical protein